jgi:hypothetical protein
MKKTTTRRPGSSFFKRAGAANSLKCVIQSSPAIEDDISHDSIEMDLENLPHAPSAPPFPVAACITIDKWVSEVACGVVPHELMEFIELWANARKSVGHLIPMSSEMEGPNERALISTYQEVTRRNMILYRDGIVYTYVDGYASILNKLPDYLVKLASEYALELSPISLEKVNMVVQDLYREAYMHINTAVVQYNNCMVQIGSDGIDFLPVTPVLYDLPVIPRARIGADLDQSSMPMLTTDAFVHPLLMPMIGALLIPTHLRQVDTRPMCILLTGEVGDGHPIGWIAKTFCTHAIVTALPKGDEFPATGNPYILYINVLFSVFNMDTLLEVKAALRRRMVVIIQSITAPAMLLLESEEALRLSIVHIPCTVHPSVGDMVAAERYLLQAAIFAYKVEGREKKRTMSFLNHVDLFPYRLNPASDHGLSVVLLMEMLQIGYGIEIRGGANMSAHVVLEKFNQYASLRGLFVGRPMSMTISDVTTACSEFRECFGYLRGDPVVNYRAEIGVFQNIGIL